MTSAGLNPSPLPAVGRLTLSPRIGERVRGIIVKI